MWRDRDNRNLAWRGTVVPKNPICRGHLVFSVGFKHFLFVRSFQALEFVGLKTSMPWIGLEIAESLSN